MNKRLPLCIAFFMLEIMTVPAFNVFLQPTLEVVAERGTINSARQTILEPVASRLGLGPEDFEERLESGGSRLVSRCGWALTYLRKAGLVAFPQRGQVKITEEGLRFLQAHPTFDKGDLEAIESFSVFAHGSSERAAAENAHSKNQAGESLPPDEQVSLSLAQIRESLIDDLLANLQNCSPTFFEKLTLKLVRELGYGKNEVSMTHTGRSGDFGIDGIISLNILGFEKIFLQAKRWQSTVGQSALRDFYGALGFQRANKGVFITTSTFSAAARTFAEGTEKKLVLIDGRRLCELMIDYKVGVEHKILNQPKIDRDYFERSELSTYNSSVGATVAASAAANAQNGAEASE